MPECSKSPRACVALCFSLGTITAFLCYRESMNLTLRQKRHCFLEKTLMKKRKKMSDHGRDSHRHHLRGTNQDYNNI